MKVKIYFFGKPNDLRDWELIYNKRINFNHDLEVIPLTPSGIKIPNQAKLKEADTLLSKISKDDFLVVLDERGKMFSSEDFAEFLVSQEITSQRLVFAIGGAHGFDERVLSRADKSISLGKMVWTKDLARLMLSEQLYRGFEIARGGNFHKA